MLSNFKSELCKDSFLAMKISLFPDNYCSTVKLEDFQNLVRLFQTYDEVEKVFSIYGEIDNLIGIIDPTTYRFYPADNETANKLAMFIISLVRRDFSPIVMKVEDIEKYKKHCFK